MFFFSGFSEDFEEKLGERNLFRGELVANFGQFFSGHQPGRAG